VYLSNYKRERMKKDNESNYENEWDLKEEETKDEFNFSIIFFLFLLLLISLHSLLDDFYSNNIFNLMMVVPSSYQRIKIISISIRNERERRSIL